MCASDGADFMAHLRASTRELHNAAERSGIYRALLCGTATRYGYGLLLRNLHPVYKELERGLDANRVLRPLARPEVYRTHAISQDLSTLFGAGWETTLPMLSAGSDYAARVRRLGDTMPSLLLAHVYTRYLGDLNGGRILARCVARGLGLSSPELAFYSFQAQQPASTEQELVAIYRAAIAAVAVTTQAGDREVKEARHAFTMNIDLSVAVFEAMRSVLRKV